MYIVSAAQMQEMDRTTIHDLGIPGRVLMENAGRGAIRWLLENFPDALERKIAVIAGRGNNGGDGFVMARYLSQMGAEVTVYLLTTEDRVGGDAAANLSLLHKLDVKLTCLPDEKAFLSHQSDLNHHQLLIDAVLGTGLQKTVKDYFKTVIDYINQSKKPVFAVDIPSGLHADTGQPCGTCVQAQATATFGYAKTGQILFPGADLTGALRIIDIGIPPQIADKTAPRQFLLSRQVAAGFLRPRPNDTHKGSHGHLLVAAGSAGATGAALMTASSAMRAGAGLTTLAVPAGVHPLIAPAATEIMTLPVGDPKCRFFDESCLDALQKSLTSRDCLALGPGIGTDEATQSLVKTVVESCPVPMVIDADGLNCLADQPDIFKNLKVRAVITPHPGEMARLTNAPAKTVQADRIGCARDFAETYGVTVALKGAATVIAHPDGRVFVNRTGNPGMASGGMGDVLTGLVAGLLGQGYPPEQAASLGVYLHGAAADLVRKENGPFGFLASDVMRALPKAIATLWETGNDDSQSPIL